MTSADDTSTMGAFGWRPQPRSSNLRPPERATLPALQSTVVQSLPSAARYPEYCGWSMATCVTTVWRR